MRKILFSLFAAILMLALSQAAHAEETMYARANLKVIKGNKITWVNYQSAKEFIPAGSKLKVTSSGDSATFVDKDGTSYSVDIGASGDQFLEKFVTKNPVNVEKYSDKVTADIHKAIITVGMTNEQAYIAMGAPAYIDGKNKTDSLTYDDIMKAKLWVYKRSTFGKNIGIEFNNNGVVTRTEGIWGK
ncbi:MAG: hypothetical protein A3J24_10580 [Deltaproteobacteria bacterium RIFCSPLOWO2_02_FULL_53_8]|nr:MAG: hypothetical protein A3J24_10580 [Deltaproteobacteria bacterium RIFCSPLOWO2_02_FULL_53_8]